MKRLSIAIVLLGVFLVSVLAATNSQSEPEPEPKNKTMAAPKKASYLDQNAVETALFMLVAVCFVLLLAFVIVLANYCGAMGTIKKLQASKA